MVDVVNACERVRFANPSYSLKIKFLSLGGQPCRQSSTFSSVVTPLFIGVCILGFRAAISSARVHPAVHLALSVGAHTYALGVSWPLCCYRPFASRTRCLTRVYGVGPGPSRANATLQLKRGPSDCRYLSWQCACIIRGIVVESHSCVPLASSSPPWIHLCSNP